MLRRKIDTIFYTQAKTKKITIKNENTKTELHSFIGALFIANFKTLQFLCSFDITNHYRTNISPGVARPPARSTTDATCTCITLSCHATVRTFPWEKCQKNINQTVPITTDDSEETSKFASTRTSNRQIFSHRLNLIDNLPTEKRTKPQCAPVPHTAFYQADCDLELG